MRKFFSILLLAVWTIQTHAAIRTAASPSRADVTGAIAL